MALNLRLSPFFGAALPNVGAYGSACSTQQWLRAFLQSDLRPQLFPRSFATSNIGENLTL